MVGLSVLVGSFLCCVLFVAGGQDLPKKNDDRHLQDTARQRQRVLVCFLTRNSGNPARVYSQQLYQLQKHAISFDGLEFDWKLLYNNQNADTRSMLRTLVTNGTDCDAFVGPLSSKLAVGTGPLIDAPQIDSASGSSELSDDVHFPYYNRINAVQAPIKVMAKTILHFGWNVVNVLCTDDTLGRDMVQTLVEAFANFPTTRIVIQHCVSANPTPEEVRLALQEVSQKSRIVVLAVNHVDEAWKGPEGILQEIQARNMHKTHVFFVPPGQPCRETAGLQNALCVDGLLNQEAFEPVLEDYAAHANVTQHREAFLDAGVSAENLALEPWNHIITHLAYDAVMFFMRAYAAAVQTYQDDPASFSVKNHSLMLTALRNFSMDGVTGFIALDEIGDRQTENLYNVYSMGNVSNTRTVVLDNRHNQINEVSQEPILWLDGTTELPEAEIEEDTTVTTYIVVFTIIVGGLIAFVALLLMRMKARMRKLGYAPKKGKVALAFTDIESSTKLWRTSAINMSKSLEIHNAIIRRNIRRHRGYEVKTVGDAFMIATASVEQMIRIAVDTQRDLVSFSSWPDPKNIPIRIRFGIHVGEPEIVFDQAAKGYDYFGNCVNTASRVEAKCSGGQILISASSLDDDGIAMMEKELNVKWEEGRMYNLKGIDNPVQLRQISHDPDIVFETPSNECESNDEYPDNGTMTSDSSDFTLPPEISMPHPANLDLQSAEFDLDNEDDMLHRLYLTVLEGFFSTAMTANETKSRFDWMARTLLTQNRPGASDNDKMRALVVSLERFVDDEAVRWECTRIAKQQGYARRPKVKKIRKQNSDELEPGPETALPSDGEESLETRLNELRELTTRNLRLQLIQHESGTSMNS